MAHPQGTNRGFIAKKRVDVDGATLTSDSSGNLELDAGLLLSGKTTGATTQNSTGLKLAGGIALSGSSSFTTQNSTGLKLTGALYLSGTTTKSIKLNSTGLVFGATLAAALPTTDNDIAITVIKNSTGVCLAVNTTGTTWKYLNVTAVQPT